MSLTLARGPKDRASRRVAKLVCAFAGRAGVSAKIDLEPFLIQAEPIPRLPNGPAFLLQGLGALALVYSEKRPDPRALVHVESLVRALLSRFSEQLLQISQNRPSETAITRETTVGLRNTVGGIGLRTRK